MANLDFASIYKEDKFDYIHSHARNFNSAIEIEGENFSQILDSIRREAISIVKRDVENFRKIEDFIAKEQIAKFKKFNVPIPKQFTTEDRHGLKNYMEFLKETLEQEGVTSLSSIVKFKSNLISIKKIGDGALSRRKKIVTDLFGAGKEFKSLDAKQKAEVKKLEKDITKEINELAENFAQYLESLVLYVLKILDPHASNADKQSNKKISAAKDLLNTFKKLNVNVKDVSIQDIEKQITSMGPERFFSTFLNDSTAKTFFNGILKNVQANSNLGELYEGALADTIISVTADEGKERVLSVFEKGDVKEVGDIEGVKDNVTMDLQFIKQQTVLGKIIFGASLKLRNPGKITSSMSQDRWQAQFKTFLGSKNFKSFSYFRKNTIALNSFNDDDTSVKTSLTELINFEKEIIEVIGLLRIIVGFYTFVNNQYQTVNSEAKEFYYTAYIFGLEGVLSSSDALESLLYSVTKGEESVINQRDSSLTEKENRISGKTLKEFWNTKQKAIKKLRNSRKEISYRNIMSDQDVLKEILILNETLGDFNYKGGVSLFTTTSKIKKVISNFNNNI